MHQQITIIGCGLLGGSFALALRRAGFAGTIMGCGGARSPQIALERGVINAIETSFDRGEICQADLIFLAAPIGGIIDFLKTRGALVKPGAIITDAGSTKSEICRVARESLPTSVAFIGGHPMAGSEHTGVEYARADLFDRASWALMNEHNGDKQSFEQLKQLVESFGARTIITSPADHDAAVALISHLPQLVSSTLGSLLLENNSQTTADIDLARKLAATGWRDMTRLSGSAWSVWRDIVMTNQPRLLEALTAMIAELQQVREAIELRDFNQVRELFEAANRAAAEYRGQHYQRFDTLTRKSD